MKDKIDELVNFCYNYLQSEENPRNNEILQGLRYSDFCSNRIESVIKCINQRNKDSPYESEITSDDFSDIEIAGTQIILAFEDAFRGYPPSELDQLYAVGYEFGKNYRRFEDNFLGD